MDYKYTGIILNKKDVGETDRIYSIYTLESGKIRVLAKSVRKANAKLAGFLENFTLAEIFIAKGQGMGKITGSIVLSSFPAMRKNLEAMQSTYTSLALFSRLIKDEETDAEIFQLLKEYLEAMDRSFAPNENMHEIISLGFAFKLLDALGYKIEVTLCANCGERIKTGDNYFSPESGGIVCGNCAAKSSEKRVKINENSIKLLRLIFHNNLTSLSKLRAERKDVANLKIISQEFLKWIE